MNKVNMNTSINTQSCTVIVRDNVLSFLTIIVIMIHTFLHRHKVLTSEAVVEQVTVMLVNVHHYKPVEINEL